LRRYLELARAERFTDAADFLDIPDTIAAGLRESDRAELARELKAVLDRHLWFDLAEVSDSASGDTTDGLAPNVDQLGVIPADGGGPAQPVRMARSSERPLGPWRFTSGTVARIPGWYAALGSRWTLEYLPAPLLRPGPLELLWWQWLALPLLLAVAYTIGSLASRLVSAILHRVVRRTSVDWDDTLLERLGGPISLGCTLAATAALIPLLSLYPPATAAIFRGLRAAIFYTFFWSLWRVVDVARLIIARSRWGRTAPSSRSLVPLGARVAKVVVIAIATVAILSLLGYPVASLVAGLGLGGLALALAAQKTVENLFGAFSLGVDQPFREGDFVKIEDFVATVEAIGLRSTRFRTLDRTLVSIPNGRLADMRLESFTARDRLRLAAVIGLVYETTAAEMRSVLQGFERVLRAHPKIWPDAVVVRFREFGASSLDIEIMAWFKTADWGEFQLIRQEILLQFMDVVERAGTSFAFPTQTLHIASPLPAATYAANSHG
jgi:MscS family membrane protein